MVFRIQFFCYTNNKFQSKSQLSDIDHTYKTEIKSVRILFHTTVCILNRSDSIQKGVHMDKIGVIHGRFQVLHKDHVKYLLAGKARCKRLIIGICNPEPDLTRYTSTNPHRSKRSANPMTYYERAECIRLAMLEAGVSESELMIVPFPVNYPEKLANYVPMDAVFYITIYDEWGREKYHMLKQELGLKVTVLWTVPLEEKGISASTIRECICSHTDWDFYVPPCVYQYITEHRIDERIRAYMMEEKRISPDES